MGTRSTIGLGKGFAIEHDRRYGLESGDFEYNFLLTIDKGFFKQVEHCEDYIEIELDENSELAQLLVGVFTAKVKNSIPLECPKCKKKAELNEFPIGATKATETCPNCSEHGGYYDLYFHFN